MTSEQKRSFWQKHIEDWQQSKLTQPKYCEQHNLSFAQFGYWRTQLNRKDTAKSKWVPVSLVKQSAIATLYLPKGIRLDVPCQQLVEVLPHIYQALPE